MKKRLLTMLLTLILFNAYNVYACGELKSINVEGATIKSTSETSYLVTLKKDVDKVYLNATTDYEWVDGFGPREVSTKEEAILRVDGNKCGFGIYTYKLEFEVEKVLIADEPTATNGTDVASNSNEDDLELKSITIDDYDIQFSPSKRLYELTVKNDVKTINIHIEKSNEDDTLVAPVNPVELAVGKNRLLINITNGDKMGSYEVDITREEKKSDNNYLASLIVDGYQLNFDPSVESYSLTLTKDVTILNVRAITESETAKSSVLGNANLENGSIITIRVTAEDETTRDYTITIIKKFNIMDYWMYIAVGVLLIILIILIILDRNKNKKKKDPTPNTIEAQENTAGVINEVKPIEPVVENAQIDLPSNENASLEIIQPTDIENATPSVDENNNPTEVFKL